MKTKLNSWSPRGPSIEVVVISKFFTKFFHYHKFQRLSNYRRGKIQLNAMHWTLISNVTIPSLWFLPIHTGRVTNSSLLGSVGKLCAETNYFNFPAPPFNHISGICKNLADTWPAATKVLSRGRKREDPGNEVDRLHVYPSDPRMLSAQQFIPSLLTAIGHRNEL